MFFKKSRLLLLTAVIGGAIAAFNSCTDYESDYVNDLQFQLDTLSGIDQVIKADIEALKKALQKMETSQQEDSTALADFKKQISDVLGINLDDQASLDEKAAIIDSLSHMLASISAFDSLYKTEYGSNLEELILWHDTVHAAVTEAYEAKLLAEKADSLAKKDSVEIVKLTQYVDSLNDTINYRFDTLTVYVDSVTSAALAEAKEYAETMADSILSLAKKYTDSLRVHVDTMLAAKVDTATLNTVIKAYQKADSLLSDRIDTLAELTAALADSIDSIKVRIDSIESRLTKVETEIVKINTKLEKMVTGIIVQATENPIYGTLLTPLGINSSLLASFYGEAGSYDVEFPASNVLNYVDASEFVDFSQFTSGTTIASAGDVILSAPARLFLTINPNTVNFDGMKVAMVNSIDEMAPGYDSLTVTKCDDKVLKFGVVTTKAASDNGFYVAEATVTDPAAAKLNVDVDAIKDAASNFIHNRSLSSLSNVALQVVNQLNGKLDAYAVKCSWNDGGKDHSVYSQYNLAAPTLKPLSYEFLKGSTGASLPMLPDLQAWLAEQGVHITTLTYNPVTATPMTVTVEIPDATTANVVITGATAPVTGTVDTDPASPTYGQISIGGIAISGSATITSIPGTTSQLVTIPASAMQTLIDQLNSQVSGMIGQANSMLNQYDNVVSLAQSKLIDRVNSYITRINKVLSNPNQLLQITMLFDNAGGSFSQVSGAQGFGTKMAVGATGVLYPTSYTAELFAPAYKKYIVVTDVRPLGGGATIASAVSAANSQENFNTVLDGDVRQISFQPSVAGEYEIAYSAVDYFGKITTRKFYIRAE